MDLDNIESLLQKYWNAETSLEEEQQLREFFASEPAFGEPSAGKPVPENLKETASLFRYFEQQKRLGVDDLAFDRELKKKLKPAGKVINLSMVQVARIAAGLFVVVAATFFVRQEIKKAYPDEPEDTYSDPKVAFEETKKALMMISKSFNKAQKEASKINVFNEATDKMHEKPVVDAKETEKKTNI
jgi:DNA helicase IV